MMPIFFVGSAQYVEADDEQGALDKIAEAYKPLKADDRPAYAVAAPDGHKWAEESYGMFKRHNEKGKQDA